ncbi:hypothetical protein M378DRAFT_16417 [Amanita muscaria Koide BX008]|uniref:Uncharacterized protein n=1 Tax=Amanita muscaria (strain Koide BX008) TaxID=946122 RepID=A0A0C2W7Q7_AMAMK|nr:hypothetical protein M378DRAFT_16417 [Amanita muscaria Koide BX008]
MSEIRRKLVIVGDDLSLDRVLQGYNARASTPPLNPDPPQDMYVVTDVEVDGKHVKLELWDTRGQDEYYRSRKIICPGSHVILICFPIDSPDSLDNVQEHRRMIAVDLGSGASLA